MNVKCVGSVTVIGPMFEIVVGRSRRGACNCAIAALPPLLESVRLRQFRPLPSSVFGYRADADRSARDAVENALIARRSRCAACVS